MGRLQHHAVDASVQEAAESRHYYHRRRRGQIQRTRASGSAVAFFSKTHQQRGIPHGGAQNPRPGKASPAPAAQV